MQIPSGRETVTTTTDDISRRQTGHLSDVVNDVCAHLLHIETCLHGNVIASRDSSKHIEHFVSISIVGDILDCADCDDTASEILRVSLLVTLRRDISEICRSACADPKRHNALYSAEFIDLAVKFCVNDSICITKSM
jgi:hypothetical protein